MFDRPLIFSNLPGFTRFILPRLCCTAFMNTSLTSVDFPEPETPVTRMSFPSGNLTLICFRLFSEAPITSTFFPVPLRLVSGTLMTFLPDRYCPVMEFSDFMISSGVPSATSSPPWMPAPGPMSTIQSALSIVSSSCSTTISELPRSLMFFRVVISFALSL